MKENLFEGIPKNAPAEIFTELLKVNDVRVERIVSFGQASPNGFWYDQLEHEWVILLEGSAQIKLLDWVVDLTVGGYLNIPSGTRHCVEKTAVDRRTVWLAIFYK